MRILPYIVGKLSEVRLPKMRSNRADGKRGRVMTWIPVEEALPKSQNEYLVTVNFDGDTYVECLHYGKPLMANREVKGECFYDSDDEWGDVVYDTGTEVIAWMPLPKPYKAEREGE